MIRSRKSKYHATKVTVGGITFDSKKEARRYEELLLLERAGKIKYLQRQVKYELIPVQREPKVTGPRGGIKLGKVIEQACSYIADFTYFDEAENLIVEDTKGFRTADYIIKRKLMLYVHGIRIKEI